MLLNVRHKPISKGQILIFRILKVRVFDRKDLLTKCSRHFGNTSCALFCHDQAMSLPCAWQRHRLTRDRKEYAFERSKIKEIFKKNLPCHHLLSAMYSLRSLVRRCRCRAHGRLRERLRLREGLREENHDGARGGGVAVGRRDEQRHIFATQCVPLLISPSVCRTRVPFVHALVQKYHHK